MNTQTDSGDNCKKCKNTTPTLSLSGQAASSDSTWCSEQTEKHTLAREHTHTRRQTDADSHKHIWSVLPLAVQKGQFFCQGNMLLANAARGCRWVFCSLSTSHTVCHTPCYSLSKSMKCAQVFWVTVQETHSWITWKESKRKKAAETIRSFERLAGFSSEPRSQSQQDGESPREEAW